MDWGNDSGMEVDAALHHASRLLLKHINCILVLHFQLQRARTNSSAISASSRTLQLLISITYCPY